MMYHKPFLPRHASSRYNPSAATNPPTHQDPRKSITIFKGHVNLCVDLGAGGPCRWAAWIVLGVIIQNLPPQSPLLLGLSYLTETNEVFKSQSKIPSTFTFFTLTLLVFSCLFLAPKLHAFPSSELASICQRNLTNAEAPIGWFEPMAPKVFIACLDKWHNANIPTWNQFFGFCLFPTSRSSVPCTPHIPLYNPSLKKMKAMNGMQKCRSLLWSKTKSTNHWSEMILEFRFPQRAFKTLPWGTAKLGVSVQWLWLNGKSLSCRWPCSKSVKP